MLRHNYLTCVHGIYNRTYIITYYHNTHACRLRIARREMAVIPASRSGCTPTIYLLALIIYAATGKQCPHTYPLYIYTPRYICTYFIATSYH